MGCAMLNASSSVPFPFSGSEFLLTPTDRFQLVCGPRLRQSCLSTPQPSLALRRFPRKSPGGLPPSLLRLQRLQLAERSLRPDPLLFSLFLLDIFDPLYRLTLSLPVYGKSS